MEMNNSTLEGIYLVVDPAVDRSILLDRVKQALEAGVDILQIWNHWPERISKAEKELLITSLLELATEGDVPVLINEDWQLLKTTQIDGVHFDEKPENIEEIKEDVGRDFISGITCGNDLEVVKWAGRHDIDYISFCAMFPSPSVSSCEIVRPEIVRKARKLTDLPLFLSGGITPDKIGSDLSELDFDGVAVISGILNANAPDRRTNEYQQAIAKHRKEHE